MFENVRLSPAFLIRPSGPPSPRGKGRQLVLPSVGVRWRTVGLGRCASIGPYETVEARSCTANQISARIPHPPLRGTWAELLAFTANQVLDDREGCLYERYDVVCEEGKP